MAHNDHARLWQRLEPRLEPVQPLLDRPWVEIASTAKDAGVTKDPVLSLVDMREIPRPQERVLLLHLLQRQATLRPAEMLLRSLRQLWGAQEFVNEPIKGHVRRLNRARQWGGHQQIKSCPTRLKLSTELESLGSPLSSEPRVQDRPPSTESYLVTILLAQHDEGIVLCFPVAHEPQPCCSGRCHQSVVRRTG
eukprot:CAMPEP_0185184672 /NCGR_PEP_ID=MMETSP1140-20130426/2709_1 /TAXON_ID=298111 /ORGANISM="Pavlova sp., Strain CCMP459" /LENGTH=192 /DNA_ID=CAMNT_0027750753 /DNA_START=744 /DNA_END=1318 /DNA_ORIENTATION=-